MQAGLLQRDVGFVLFTGYFELLSLKVEAGVPWSGGHELEADRKPPRSPPAALTQDFPLTHSGTHSDTHSGSCTKVQSVHIYEKLGTTKVKFKEEK